MCTTPTHRTLKMVECFRYPFHLYTCTCNLQTFDVVGFSHSAFISLLLLLLIMVQLLNVVMDK